MSNVTSNIVIPVACAIAFCGAAVLGISAKPTGQNQAVLDNEKLKKEEVATVQHSFPVFYQNEKTGHCVLGIRTPIKKSKGPYTDPKRAEERKAIYAKASTILADAADGNAVCADLFAEATEIADVTEFVFLLN